MTARPVHLLALVCALVVVAACDVDTTASDERDRTGIAGPTRDDVECDEDTLGTEAETTFITAHYVVDGTLGAVCFGDEDPTLIDAWQALAAISPPGQLGDLAVFAGFVTTEAGDEETLAFVNTLDDLGTVFQMSVGLDAYDADPDEALLTLAHEFSHVFTGLSTQLDRTAESAEGCTTYDNGEGCYAEDSLLWSWIQAFWSEGLLGGVDPERDATVDEGQARCDANPGFFGAYAASNPEEDFAESFGAFVFRLDAATPGQQAKLDWLSQQAGVAEFRTRAEAAGLGPLPNRFDTCGAG